MSDLSRTSFLLNQFRSGDELASDKLIKIFRPMLQKWSHGRVPVSAQSFMDTEDLVQETIMLAFKNKDKIRASTTGQFFSFLRTTLINQIKQELRKNKPFHQALTTHLSQNEKVAYEEDLNALLAYDNAISKLNDEEQQAVILRVEIGFSHQEIADLLNKNSADAARVFIARALKKLAKYIPENDVSGATILDE